MIIGLDFDNTIVCYDQAIARLADELLNLPKAVPRTKLSVRDHLRGDGREGEWTAFQGALYGPGMQHAQPFSGCLDTLRGLATEGHAFRIVSHRSARPYAGEPYDLHYYANQWIAANLESFNLIDNKDIFFLESQSDKLKQIKRLNCDLFVDDLIEVLTSKEFPKITIGVLFDPDHRYKRKESSPLVMNCWHELINLCK